MVTLNEKFLVLRKAKNIFSNWIYFPLSYFKILKRDFVIFKTRTNKILKIRQDSTDLLALTNVWLIEEYNHPNFKINSDDIIIDIGAHIGLFTVYASQFCNKGKIFSFEPVNENFKLLKENIKLNNLTYVKPFNLAVSKNNGTVTLFINDDQAAHSVVSTSSQKITIDSISLEKIFLENKLDHCDLLKLDCEGAEYDIIKNLPKEYFEKINKIILEYHLVDSKPNLLNELKILLSSQNFQIETKSSFDGMGFLYAQKTPSIFK